MRPFSRISLRLLLFNVLLVFVPAAGFLYLHVYERQLLEAQERSMVQQARLVAAALEAAGAGERAASAGVAEPRGASEVPTAGASPAGDGAPPSRFDRAAAERLLAALDAETEARLRIYDRAGTLLADSARLGPRRPAGTGAASDPYRAPAARQSLVYRIGAGIYRFYRSLRVRGTQAESKISRRAPPSDPSPLPAVREALAGRYGALALPNQDPLRPSLQLHSALPVTVDGKVAGAVLVSQSTVKLLRALDQVRVEIFQVVLGSLTVALLVSLLLAGTIARPLRRLAAEARALLDRRGRLRDTFRGSGRPDEIGDLARALEELTHRIGGYQRTLEGFAADLSHEMKNPLASIRSATELLAEVDDPAERARFLGLVEREVARMERLLSAVREMGEIDAGIEPEAATPLDLRAVLAEAVEGASLRAERGVTFAVRAPAWPVMVRASPSRLGQALGNLLDNARSFSPGGGQVEVSLAVERQEPSWAVLRIADRGPGIPEGNLDRLFDRFFTYRPGETRARERHTGLGLAIVRSIVEGYGGTVTARNRDEGGACFEVRLGVG